MAHQLPPYAAYASPQAAIARAKLTGPAIGLIVAAAVNLLLIVLRFVLGVLEVPPPPPNVDPDAVVAYQVGFRAMMAMIALGGITNVLTLLGGIMMLQQRMRGLAMTGAILAMLPCLSCCWPLGLGMGIWALVVLSDGQVRAAFQGR